MRKIIIGIACCIVLLLLGYSGYRGYQVWKQNHLLTMARNFSAQGDVRNEILSLQQAIRINPRNIDACRMIAGLTEAVRAPGAVIWRQRVLELNPSSTDDRLALAKTAMVLKDYVTATNALAGLDDAGKKTPAYHNLAGVMATSLGQVADAEMHFSEAVRLEPSNLVSQVNLDVVRLRSSNALDLAEARISLKRISVNATNSALRAQARRELVVDAMQTKDISTALTLSQELVQPTNTAFSDKLLRLDVLSEGKKADLKTDIIACQQEAATNPAKLSDMARWLMTRNSPAVALAWLQTLPKETQTNQPAALLAAQCQILVEDWPGLQRSLEKQNWDDTEFIRHAFLARSLQAQKLEVTSTAEWELALKYAGNQKGTTVSLFQLAAQWSWVDKAESILWTIVNRYPEELWAGQALKHALYMGGRTRPLMQLFSLQAKRLPNDMEIKNDLATTALLLGAQELEPDQLAQTVYENNPKNTAYVTTYAFSLYLQKKYADALKVMQQLTPQEQNNPAIAGYYGLILKATGDNAKAKAYLGLTTKPPLLPEERKLFQQAMSN